MKKLAKKQDGGGNPIDSTSYFNKKFDNAYKDLKSGKISKKEALLKMNKATEGSTRQTYKKYGDNPKVKEVLLKKQGGAIKTKTKK